MQVNLNYSLISLEICLNIFMGLVLVHFKKYWLFKSEVVGYFAHIRNKIFGVSGYHLKSKI